MKVSVNPAPAARTLMRTSPGPGSGTRDSSASWRTSGPPNRAMRICCHDIICTRLQSFPRIRFRRYVGRHTVSSAIARYPIEDLDAESGHFGHLGVPPEVREDRGEETQDPWNVAVEIVAKKRPGASDDANRLQRCGSNPRARLPARGHQDAGLEQTIGAARTLLGRST